jgi:hypothetical protein
MVCAYRRTTAAAGLARHDRTGRKQEKVMLEKLCMLAIIVGALVACQSGGGTASLNPNYSDTNSCDSYDYSNVGLGLCPGRQWH